MAKGIARTSSILGANYDANPKEISCLPYKYVSFMIIYTFDPLSVNGKVNVKLERCFTLDKVNYWSSAESVVQTGDFATNPLASTMHAEEIEFVPTSTYASIIWDVGLHNSDKIRLRAKESGTPAQPGTCLIIFRLSL